MSEEIEHNDQDNPEASEENYAVPDEGGEEFTLGVERKPMGKGSVAMFIILAIAGAGTYMMYARTGPQSASAAGDPKAHQVITQFMSDRDKNLGTMKKMLQDTEGIVKEFLNYPSVKQIPLGSLSGNPFRMVIANAPDNTHKDEEADKKKREEERATALAAANQLRLQSIMSSGAKKSCMINNALYTEGQEIDSFTIEKIKSDGVIVRMGTFRFNVPMQR